MSEDDLPFLERTMLRHWVLQWLKLVSWYYTVLASDYVTIEEALSGPVVATDWRAQKDVNSALLNGRDGVMFCTGTLTSIVSGYTLVQQAGVTQPTAVLFRSFNVATSEKDPSLSWLEKMEDVEVELLSRVPQALEKQKSSASLRGWGNKEACGRGGEGGATSPLPLLFPDYPSLPSPSAGPSSKILVPPCPLEVPAPVPQDAELYEQVLQPLPDLMQPLPDPFDLSNLLFNSIVDPLWDSIPLKLFDILTNGEFSIPQGTAVRFLLDLGEK
ncbi:hypothetical protein L1987_89021 [Smallanthus sonchifolius]|nr:hypothetical protein L1987_89799 [Smallanthus sonchifolius]KAI3664658.1 hypothetical protein L1987_89577 [Smallanthus sonchifolius]KAI3666462.1 hypothetical protein L1987_89021 [Smallanthus sonchifolius]